MKPVRLVLAADYQAGPLWYPGKNDGPATVAPCDDFPLSTETKVLLQQWVDRFNQLADTGYEWPSDQERWDWVRDGESLLTLVQDELGPRFDVKLCAT